MDKETLITQIIEVFVKLNHIAGNFSVEREGLSDMERGLNQMEADELQALFTDVTQSAILALQRIDADIQEIAKEGIRRLESIDREADASESAKAILF